jgi:cystathionine beta-lyase/cystathionine gamma-synthase
MTNTPESLAHFSAATRAIHGDDGIQQNNAVAPPMHVSTTFRYNDDPDKLVFWGEHDPNADRDTNIYSRDSAPNTNRLEAVLTSLLGGKALTYSSGLSAFHAMMVHLKPKRIAIGAGYHGCHGIIDILNRLYGCEKLDLDSDEIREGDVIHVETPLNPTGEARNLAHYAAKAKKAGAYLTVDATFAPPPLLAPFELGADIVMHSGTKYFGGHSDMLCGVLAVAPSRAEWWAPLKKDRLLLGAVMGNFEGWLGLRSLRTLEIRVKRQSETATRLVKWLNDSKANLPAVERLSHASLQEDAWVREQMPNGFGPVFGLVLKNDRAARAFPSKLALFHHCTSLGGVESTIEWRRMTDPNVDTRLLRVSIGLESFEDLQADIQQALDAVDSA